MSWQSFKKCKYKTMETWEIAINAKYPRLAIRKCGAGSYLAVNLDTEEIVGRFGYVLGGWIADE